MTFTASTSQPSASPRAVPWVCPSGVGLSSTVPMGWGRMGADGGWAGMGWGSSTSPAAPLLLGSAMTNATLAKAIPWDSGTRSSAPSRSPSLGVPGRR